MSLQRICDRCGVDVAGPLDGATRNVIVPVASPSTAKVSKDMPVQIGVQSPNDLCDLCLLSAVVELAIASLGPSLTPDVLAAIGARAKLALSGA